MAERYLLFDAGCLACSRLARDIEHATDGRIVARSLREPAMQTLLDGAQPGWRWEPTLVEVDGARARAYTGAALRAKLFLVVGPRRTLRVAHLVRRAPVSVSPVPPTQAAGAGEQIGRQRLLARGAALLGGAILVGKLSPQHLAAAAGSEGPQGHHNLIRLPSDSPLVEHLKQHPAILEASTQFGTPNWDGVYRADYEHDNTRRTAYMILYPVAAHGATTFLMVDDPASSDISVAGQVTRPDRETIVFAWSTAAGQHLGTITIKNGHVTATPPLERPLAGAELATAGPATLGQTRPQFNGGCFFACVGFVVRGACYYECITCAAFPDPFNPGCIACAGCAGVSAIGCAIACR